MITLEQHLAAHRIESAVAWHLGTAGLRAWCECGWHSEIIFDANDIEAGKRLHETHVAATWQDARTITTEDIIVGPVGPPDRSLKYLINPTEARASAAALLAAADHADAQARLHRNPHAVEAIRRGIAQEPGAPIGGGGDE